MSTRPDFATYVSDATRPAPPLTISYPDTWTAETAQDAIVVLAEPPEEGFFRANVLVASDRLDAGVELEDAVVANLANARAQYPDLRIVQEKVVRIDDGPANLRLQRFQPAELAHPVFQMQVLTLAPDAADQPVLVHLVATCLAADADRYADVFAEIAASLAFDRP
jgi:hypothetical protein